MTFNTQRELPPLIQCVAPLACGKETGVCDFITYWHHEALIFLKVVMEKPIL